MTTSPVLREHTAAVVAALVAAGLSAEAGRKPADLPTGGRYVVVWPGPSDFDGPVADPSADVAWGFQLTGVGTSVEQAEWVADDAQTAVLPAGAVAVPNRAISGLRATHREPARRDDDVSPPAWYVAQTYQAFSSPA